MKFTSIVLAFIVGLTFFILFPYLFILLNSYFSLPIYANDFFKIIGLVLILFGLGLIIYCSGLFLIFGKGTPVPIEPPKKLVATGLYRYTRNPIYIAYFVILLGEFFVLGHLFLLLYFILFIIGTNMLLMFHEEPVLKKRFGKSYEKYLKDVPRWL